MQLAIVGQNVNKMFEEINGWTPLVNGFRACPRFPMNRPNQPVQARQPVQGEVWPYARTEQEARLVGSALDAADLRLDDRHSVQ